MDTKSNSYASLIDELPMENTESWIDIREYAFQTRSPIRLHTHTPDGYLSLLREAQRESNESSRHESMRGSPKSPPNSPTAKDGLEEEQLWRNYYVNTEQKFAQGVHVDVNSAVPDWSSSPNPQSPKDNWIRTLSVRKSHIGDERLFSKSGMSAMALMTVTNICSLLIGLGIGWWLFRRGATLTVHEADVKIKWV